MIVMESPQFQTQDDFGMGDGISAIPQWQVTATEVDPNSIICLDNLDNLDPNIGNILIHLRNILGEAQLSRLTTTDLHDLTSFVLHRLLLWSAPEDTTSQSAIVSQCVRYATALYMFIIHGPTYYSHASFLHTVIVRFQNHLQALPYLIDYGSLVVWFLSIGMVASIDMAEYSWFSMHARGTAVSLDLHTWSDILARLESILWLKTQHEELFRKTWQDVIGPMTR